MAKIGDALRITQDSLNEKNFYAYNPAFDRPCKPGKPGKPGNPCKQ